MFNIKRKLTLADVLSLFGNLFPGVEGEIGRVVNSLSCNFSVVFVIEGEHSTQEEVDDYSDGPEVDFFPVRFL